MSKSRIYHFIFFLTFSAMLQAQNLPAYLSLVQVNNPAITENNGLIAVARLEVEKAKSIYRLPEISTTANFLYAPVFRGYGYDESITNGSLYSAQVNVNMPLFTRPQVEAQRNSSGANEAIYRQNIALSQHELERQITEQYIKTWQNLERIASAQMVLDILKEQEKVIRVFAKNAIFSQSDVLFFTIEIENQEIAIQEYEIAYREGLSMLNLLSGKADTNYIELQPPDIHLKTDTSASSNFIKSFQLDSLLAARDQELNEMKYRPQVSAFYNQGLNAIMLKDIYKKFGFSLGLNFSMTLFDGNQKALNRQQTQIKQQSSHAMLDYQTKQIQQQRLIVLQQIRNLETKLAVLQNQLADYLTLLQFYRTRIAQGELSVNDYINTIKLYANSLATYTSLASSRLLLINNYNYWNW